MAEFLGALIWLACLIALIWGAWRLGTRNARRAKLKDAERKEFHHITGSRQWWKQTPGDPPEGDH